MIGQGERKEGENSQKSYTEGWKQGGGISSYWKGKKLRVNTAKKKQRKVKTLSKKDPGVGISKEDP